MDIEVCKIGSPLCDVNFWDMQPRAAEILDVRLRIMITTFYSLFAIRDTLITSFREYHVVYATSMA